MRHESMSNVTLANRQPRLIAQRRRERQEPLHVGEVAGNAHRHADGAGALAAAVGDELQKARQRHVVRLVERRQDVVFGDALGGLAGAGIAEAPGAERDALRAGHLLDAPVVEQVARRDRRSSSSRRRRAWRSSSARRCGPSAGRWRAAARAARRAASRSGTRTRVAIRLDAVAFQVSQADRPPPESTGSSACRPRTRPRPATAGAPAPAPSRSSPCRRQTTAAPAAASASRRASRQPTPVG